MRVTWAKGLRGMALTVLLLGGVARTCVGQDANANPAGTDAEKQAAGEPVVVSIRIVHEDGSVLKRVPTGLQVELGKPLDRGQVAASLRTLYKSGDYANLRAVTTPVEGGVQLDFVVEENLYFNQVNLRGLVEPPSEASAAAAMQIQLGEAYRKEKLDAAIVRLQDILKEEGLYQAKVTVETQIYEENHQIDVIVHVAPGIRAHVSAVQLTNNTEYPDVQILSRLKMKAGTAITNSRVQKGTANIRKFLAKKGHLSGRAAVRRGEYDAGKNSVPLTLDVTEGPRVRVEVAGAKFSHGDLKRLLPFYQEGAVDADLLEEGKRNLLERLERQGYFDAKVDYATATQNVKEKGSGWQGTEEVITYTVARGERHKLVGIGIAGNKYFDTELLRSRLTVYQSAFGSRGKFSGRLIEADRVSMEGLYRSNGFLDVRVDAEKQDDYRKNKGDLLVRFVVNEGIQTRVASLKIEGNRAFTDEELQGVVGSLPGQPYSEVSVGSDRANILALYFNQGYPEATLRPTVEEVEAKQEEPAATQAATEKNGKKPATEFKEVKVTYHIDEGPQTRVRRVLVSGFVHTRPGMIRRNIQVKPNAPLRQGEVVDTQRRLYNLGIFNRVTVSPQNPMGADPDKDVVALVEEAKRYTLAYGGGFEVQRLASSSNPTGGAVEAAPRGILEISKLNLTGRADTLSLKLRGSTLQWRALLGYSSPNTFASPNFSFQATAYVEKTKDINTFDERRYEGTVQLTEQVSPRTTILYRYSFRKVLVSDLKILPEQIPLFQQPTLVSQFGISWVRDTRDNPADATKGTLNSADFGVADTYFGSSASFTRVLYQNSSYYPIKKRFSFARSIRFGVLNPYRDTVSLTFPVPTGTDLPQLIPLPERFFAGGGTSLRGFALNQAGPRDNTGFPVGGQAMLVLNQEFRFPMRLPYFGTSLGGALFYDGGNVYSRANRISFRSSLPKPTFDNSATPQCLTNCSNELNYFAHTVGLGLRYATPVGPIRVDLGYQFNRPFFVEAIPCPSGTTPTTCHPGSLGYKAARLPGFQIFFNLGSSF